MNFTSSRRLLVATLAVAAAGGTGAAVATTQTPAAVHSTATTAGTAPAATSPTTAPAPITPTTTGPVSAAQATLIAERQGHGRAAKTEAETDETSGPTYDVKVIRPGGIEVKVAVDANTGRVLRADVDTAEQGDAADAQDQADARDS